MFSFFNNLRCNIFLYKYIPDLITALRIFITIGIIAVLKNDYYQMGTFIFFNVLIFLSDLIDGKIARRFNLESNLGELLDILADIFYVISITIIMVFKRVLPLNYVLIVIVEFGVFIITSKYFKKNKKYVAFDAMGRILAVAYYIYPLIAFITFKEWKSLYNLLNDKIIIILSVMTFITIVYRISLCFKKAELNTNIKMED